MLFYHFGYGPHGPSRRGKRLRPRLLMIVAQALGASIEEALDAAAALEMLHNYSLVHDDIEDRDELRHGRRTLWSVYGVAQAINAGDALCAVSFLTLACAVRHHPADRVLAMVDALHAAHRIMCDGQSLDIAFETAAQVDLDTYERMIACKTAALFEAACALGAYCGGADAAAIAAYRSLGRAFGMAFQIRDDVLGIWADQDATGKIAGNDIARRKWTFPVVWALAQPQSRPHDVVREAYAGGAPLQPGEVARVVAALDQLGAREAAGRAIAEHVGVLEAHSGAQVREFLLGSLDLVPRIP